MDDNILLELMSKGIKLEKENYIDKAVDIYEELIKHEFEGNRPYDRLAIIYRKRKDYQNEIRVLEKAIEVFENKVYIKRHDRKPKLDKFNKRLIKAKELLKKHQE